MSGQPTVKMGASGAPLSLYHLLDPEVLANPYPLFRRMRSEDPVHWDPFLHAWVVTRYADVLEVLLSFSADRTPTPAQLDEMGLSSLNPIASVMVKQMLFLDAPAHTRLRGLSSNAFTPARLEQLRAHIRDITKNLLDAWDSKAELDVIAEMARLRGDLSLIPSAIEEMLRYESPSQHTARMCPSDREMGGKRIQKRQAVIAVMAAANRDPEKFPDPDKFDITRKDNRHLAFGYAAHFCFGAPLARVEGQVVLEAFLKRFPEVVLAPAPLEWRSNLGLRGLKALKVRVGEPSKRDRSDLTQPAKPDAASAAGKSSGCPYEAQGSSDKQGLSEKHVLSDKQALIKKYLQ